MTPPARAGTMSRLRGRHARRGLTRAIGVVMLCLATTGCAWLDMKQRQLALRPTPTQPAEVVAAKNGDQRFTLPVAAQDGQGIERLALWWMPNADADAPTLLYLHGTFRNLYRNLPKIDALRGAGFSVLAVDYRGWGDSSYIIPSEATIVADAWLAWDELVRRQPLPGRRVIYGHSMGGAVAVTLASQLHAGTDYGALILESTFSNLPDVAAAAGFWGSLGAAITTLRFDSMPKIGSVDAPILMLHGTADRTVPIEVGRKLRDAAPEGVTWIEVDGGTHSRLHEQAGPAYAQRLRELMGELRSAAAAAPAPKPEQP